MAGHVERGAVELAEIILRAGGEQLIGLGRLMEDEGMTGDEELRRGVAFGEGMAGQQGAGEGGRQIQGMQGHAADDMRRFRASGRLAQSALHEAADLARVAALSHGGVARRDPGVGLMEGDFAFGDLRSHGGNEVKTVKMGQEVKDQSSEAPGAAAPPAATPSVMTVTVGPTLRAPPMLTQWAAVSSSFLLLPFS